jgi:FMN reductase
MNSMNVLGVGSSMRKASYGTKALKIVLGLINRYDAKTRLLDLREIVMPIYDPDLSNGADKKIQKVTD